MADLKIPSNSQNGLKPQNQKSSWWNLPRDVWDGTVGRGFVNLSYRLFSSEAPLDSLRRIEKAANYGLDQMKSIQSGIGKSKLAPLTHSHLDERLKTEIETKPSPKKQGGQRGEVADLGKIPDDAEVTRALSLKDRIEATDWEKENQVRRGDLIEKIAVYSTLRQMRERCGLEDEGSYLGKNPHDPEGAQSLSLKKRLQTDNLALMRLVRRATGEEGAKISVWQLFTEHYQSQLTFFQKLKAAWFYFLYYQTSLINNIVVAYLGKFIENITQDLADPTSKTRIRIIRSLLSNTEDFLRRDLRVTRIFGKEERSDSLEQLQNQAIEELYGFDLPGLCKAFSEKRVDTDSPTVSVLDDYQKIPVLGWAFKGFAWMINYFIRRVMKYEILPKSTQSMVEEGLELTNNLPFALSLTRFLNKHLEQLRDKIEQGKEMPKPSESDLPGVKVMLPHIIKNLKKVLELEGIRSPLDVRKKFKELDEGKKWWNPYKNYIDPRTDEAIEDGITKATELFLHSIHEILQTGEGVAKILELATDPFQEGLKDETLLQKAYDEEHEKLMGTAKDFFELLAKRAVADKFSGKNPEKSQDIAESSFREQKEIVQFSFHHLNEICKSMTQKIKDAKEKPSEETNIQADIAVFLETIVVLSSRSELRKELEDVKPEDQNVLWSALSPLFKRVEKIQERILRLQDLQDQYPSDASVVEDLNRMKELLSNPADPLSHSLIQTLQKMLRDLTPRFGAKAGLKPKLEEFITQISQHSKNIAKEQSALDAISALYPPRFDDGKEKPPQGFLDELLHYEQGIHSRNFSPRACRNAIAKQLALLPAEEKAELEAILGNYAHLRMKWKDLGSALQKIYARHLQLKHQNTTLLKKIVEGASQWAEDKIEKYKIVKEQDYHNMKSEMNQISKEVGKLLKAAQKINPKVPHSLPTRITDKLLMLSPLVGGGQSDRR